MLPPSVRHSCDMVVSHAGIPSLDVAARVSTNEPARESKPRVIVTDITNPFFAAEIDCP